MCIRDRSNAALTLGGTGLIIITGVALETTKQIKTLITRKEYHEMCIRDRL